MNKDGKKRLGMGLEGLLGFSSIEEAVQDGVGTSEILIDDIVTDPNQPRKIFSHAEISELADSIRENGLIQPIVVKNDRSGKYIIIAGERRFRAFVMLQYEKIPCIIKDIDTDSFHLSLIENIQRSDLSPIEEAYAYKYMHDNFQYTQNDIARKIGKSRSHIANMLRIAELPEDVQRYAIDNNISHGILKVVAGKENAMDLLHNVVKNDLSVRALEVLIAEKSEKSGNIKKRSEVNGINLKPFEKIACEKLGIKIDFNIKNSLKSDCNISFQSQEKLDEFMKFIENYTSSK